MKVKPVNLAVIKPLDEMLVSFFNGFNEVYGRVHIFEVAKLEFEHNGGFIWFDWYDKSNSEFIDFSLGGIVFRVSIMNRYYKGFEKDTEYCNDDYYFEIYRRVT